MQSPASAITNCPRWALWWPTPSRNCSTSGPSSATCGPPVLASTCCGVGLLVVAELEALALAAPDHGLLDALVLRRHRVLGLLVPRLLQPVDQLVGAVALEEVGPWREPVELVELGQPLLQGAGVRPRH